MPLPILYVVVPMRCPYCFSTNLSVIDSRGVSEENSVRRRRVCNSCDKRFTTYEKIMLAEIMVIKKDGMREAFDRNKILNGITKACEKRPVKREAIETIGEKIEEKIRAKGVREVKTSRIGEMVIKELYKLDPVAYVRFASVYNQYSSPTEFIKAVSQFHKKAKKVLESK